MGMELRIVYGGGKSGREMDIGTVRGGGIGQGSGEKGRAAKSVGRG